LEAARQYRALLQATDTARAHLYRMVVAGAEASMPLSRLAAATGLSRTRVAQIVRAGEIAVNGKGVA
jgi:hypothetical protein